MKEQSYRTPRGPKRLEPMNPNAKSKFSPRNRAARHRIRRRSRRLDLQSADARLMPLGLPESSAVGRAGWQHRLPEKPSLQE